MGEIDLDDLRSEEKRTNGFHLAAVVAGLVRCRGSTSASTCQSAQKPYCDSGSSLKLAPMDRSGTTMIACFRP